jgi:hypothetical protein
VALYELGELVELVYIRVGTTVAKKQTFKRPRPRLASNPAGDLVVVEVARARVGVKKVAAQVSAKALKQAEADYRGFHWGDEPTWEVGAQAPAVRAKESLTVKGEILDVVYKTAKAGEVYEWTHRFKTPRPVLAQTKAGGLVIVGGSYFVEDRGIVG